MNAVSIQNSNKHIPKQQYKTICWLLNLLCRYLPLKQWPLTTPRINPTKNSSPTSRNKGSKKQLLCKVCSARFSQAGNNRFSSLNLRSPHCGHSLAQKKDRKHFVVHKYVNPNCPFYLHNLKKVDKKDLDEDFGKNKYKLHYIYREFLVNFFHMDLNSLLKNAFSLKFSKFDSHSMSLCLILHVNLGHSLRKPFQAFKNLCSISISHQQIAYYCKSAVICIKPFVDHYDYELAMSSTPMLPTSKSGA